MSAIRFGDRGRCHSAHRLRRTSGPNDGTTAPPAAFNPGAAGAASGAMVVRGEAFFFCVIFDAKEVWPRC
jgi:hypothetical protein